MNITEIITVTLILFSVIDILGTLPVIIDLRKKYGHIQSEKATLISGLIMVVFLFVGDNIIKLLGLDLHSFSLAGAIIIFLIGTEMVLNIEIFKHSETNFNNTHILPIAFPLLAGAGTLTTILTLDSQYTTISIVIAIFINLIFVYIILKATTFFERVLGNGGVEILRKVFGIILLALAIKIIKTNIIEILQSIV